PWHGRVRYVLEHVLGVRDTRDQQCQQSEQPEHAGSYRRLGEPALCTPTTIRDHVIPPNGPHFLMSPKAIVACRSIQPPEPFGTSSTSSIWSSLIAVMRPKFCPR